MSSEDVQDHLDFMQLKLTEAWERLNGIWTKVGYDEEVLAKRQNTVVKHLTELLEDMCQEAEHKLEEKKQALEVLMQEISQLGRDLSIGQVPEVRAASGKPLLEMEEILVEIADDLRKRKAIRMEKYNNINAKVVEISDELDETPMKIEFQGIPADSQVSKLEHHLGQLHEEKIQRLDKFYNYKKTITELFELLERSPKNDMELLVTETDEINSSHTVSANGVKVLSRATLRALEEIKARGTEQIEANTRKGVALWQKIRELWSRLSADEEMMLIFSQVHRPISTSNWEEIYKPSVLKGLQKELERLEEEKRLNMSLFIKQCREELCDLWMNKCFMTSVQIRFMESNYLGLTPFAITDFNDEVYTEELLEKHEAEVEYWKSFIERNKKIIDGVIKRGEMFAQYKTHDQKSDDPSRLANRGGALLREEKERKKLEKAIPKLESELKQLCDEFEQEFDAGYGMTKFLVYGRTINEMIEQDWEQFHEEKRLRKEAKKKPNDPPGANRTMMTTQLGNPGSRKRPATPTSAQRGGGGVTPVKRNKTTALTPGKTFQSPFVQPSNAAAPSNSVKRPLTKVPRVAKNKKQGNQSMNKSWYFRPNTSSTQAASKKILRKSIGKVRNGSSLQSDSSSSGSSSSFNKCSSSQPNLQFHLSSLEQLNFSKVLRGHGPPLAAIKEKTPKIASSKDNFPKPSPSPVTRSTKKIPSKTGLLTRQPSAGKLVYPTKLTGKEQVPPSSLDKNSKDSIISPVASYSEFTDHLLCQSTLNSSAVVPIHKQVPGPSGTVPTTPTKSGMTFAPAKLPLSDNCF